MLVYMAKNIMLKFKTNLLVIWWPSSLFNLRKSYEMSQMNEIMNIHDQMETNSTWKTSENEEFN